MSNPIPHIATETKISFVYEKEMRTVEVMAGTDRYHNIIDAIHEGDEARLESLISPSIRVEEYSDNYITITNDGDVFLTSDFNEGVEDYRFPDFMKDKLLFFMENDIDYKPIVRFWQRLRNNPQKQSCDQLYEFLSRHNYAITREGNFIAYKKVTRGAKGNLWDSHTYDKTTRKGTYMNNPGDSPEMPREKVEFDPTKHCAPGLHVANWDYAQTYAGNVLVQVEVDPRDVVSVPNDHDHQKLRTSRYTVLDIISEDAIDDPTKEVHYFETDNDNDDFYDDFEYDDCGYDEDTAMGSRPKDDDNTITLSGKLVLGDNKTSDRPNTPTAQEAYIMIEQDNFYVDDVKNMKPSELRKLLMTDPFIIPVKSYYEDLDDLYDVAVRELDNIGLITYD